MSIDGPRFTMNSLDLRDFQNAIYQSGGNVLAPVIVPSVHFPQSLAEACDQPKEHPRNFFSVAGPVGIGQFSLDRKTPTSLIARWDIHIRQPSDLEMQADLNEYGEQVMGPEVSEVKPEEQANYADAPKIKMWGSEYYFAGPARVVQSVFTTRVFNGLLPNSSLEILAQIDGSAEKGNLIRHQQYFAIEANEGMMVHKSFGDEASYSVKPKNLGIVKREGTKLLFYPANGASPLDFTANSYKGD